MEVKTLKDWRLEKGIKKVFVQKALGLTEKTLRMKEEGLSQFKLDEVRILLDLYGIAFEQIAD